MNLGNIDDDDELDMTSEDKTIFNRILGGKSGDDKELYVDDMLEDDEDFEDFDDDEIEETNFKKQTIKKKEILPEKEEDLFPDYVILDSSKSKKEGPVLRFSELFKSPEIPLPPDPYISKQQRIKKKKDTKVHVELEDEGDAVEKEFESLSCEVKIKKLKEPEKKTDRNEESKKPKRKESQLDENAEEVMERTNFKPLDLLEWENDIIWETTEEKKTTEMLPEATNEKKKFLKTRIKKDKLGYELWGTFELYNPEEEKKLEKQPIIPFNSQAKPPGFLPFTSPSNPNPSVPLSQTSPNIQTTPYGRIGFQQPLKMGFLPPTMNPNSMYPMPQNMNQNQLFAMQQTMNQSPMFSKTNQPFLPSSLPGNPGFKPSFSPMMPTNPIAQRSPMTTPIRSFTTVAPQPGTPNFSSISTTSITPKPLGVNIVPNSPIGSPPSANAPLSTVTTPTSAESDKKPKKRYGRKKKTDEEEKTNESETTEEVKEKEEIIRDANLTKIKSIELDKGDWLFQVIWDDNVGAEKPMNTKLILDLNDKNMIFQQDKIQKNQVPVSTGKVTDAVEPTTILTRIEQSANPFNLSNDRDYEVGGIYNFQKKGRHIVKHSLPALELDPVYFRTYIPNEELKILHRPKFDIVSFLNRIIPIEYRIPKKEKPNKRKLRGIQKASDLSAHDHRLVLFEYIEEQPPLLNNVGMATKICNYYKNPENEQELPPAVDDGIPILVDSEESIPLIGKLEDGKFLKSTENTLYSAQIFKHDVSETDFILTTRPTENGSFKFYVREIPIIYSVGHTQPHIECPAPNSRQAIQFTKNRLNLFIYRTFSKASNVDDMKIRIDDIRETFPTMSETSIRKRLKECADFQRGGDASGYWTAKKDFVVPPEEQLFDLVTPEMVAMNESMEAGQLRLDETGITNDAAMAGFAFSSAKLGSGFDKYADVINFIENERKNTPWNKTSNFINAIEGKEGSKLELLSIATQNLKKEEMEQLSKIAEDAGRIESEKTHQISLSHEEAKQILIEKGGYTEERIQKMASRTERKMAARKILESLGQGGRKNNVKEKAKNTKFREILANIFVREAKKLENGTPYYEDKEDDFAQGFDDMVSDDDDEFSDLEKDLEEEFEKAKSDDEDEEELFKKPKKLNMDSDSDSDTMSVKSLETVQPEKKKKYFVRKTTIIHHPNGTTEDKVEIIRDPNLVEYYIKRREKKASTAAPTTSKGQSTSGTDTTHSQKDRRRLQDQFRRWMKEKEKKVERLGSGETLQLSKEKKPKVPGEQKPRRIRTHQAKIKTNIKCGTCGEIGHMSTNRSCPKFSESKHAKLLEEGNDDIGSGDTKVTIQQEGSKPSFKLSISTSVLNKGKKKKDSLEYLGSPIPQLKRRRKTTTDQIADIFHKIIDTIKQHPAALPFLNPVDKGLFPDYRKIIQKPVDLSGIHKKIADLRYLDADAFLSDFELMASNAHTYCENRFPTIPPQADQVVDLVKAELKKYESQLDEIINAPTTPLQSPSSLQPKKKKLELSLNESSISSFQSDDENSLLGLSETPSSVTSPTGLSGSLDFENSSNTMLGEEDGMDLENSNLDLE